MVGSLHSERVRIKDDTVDMEGVLWMPEEQIGVILFASGMGGSRLKPPGDYVGSVLRGVRIGTLWLDLLSQQDVEGCPVQPDVALLTQRLRAACDWLRNYDATRDLPVGLFAAGKGAAAALQLAAAPGTRISAIVSRGGRLDMAEHGTLAKVSAPTMLIVGGLDDRTVGVNRAAYAALRCKKKLEIIPGATQAFEEPGSPEVVARLARGWFLQNMRIPLRM
ncbi:MAG TPA: alpha/beta hydrolase [Noviherbaspirillum sp.]